MIFMLALPQVSFANKFSEIEVVELMDSKDNTTDDYQVVNLLIDGNDVLSDVPAILYDLDGKTRTLVPVSFITDRIGGSISWDGPTRTTTITYEGKTIQLPIDSPQAIVDGKTYDLPNGVPAKLMAYEGNYRTMVPVNFITQHLGYEIFWQGETMTVSINRPKQSMTGIRYDNSGTYPELRFKVTDQVSATSFSVDGQSVGGKDTLTLDFHNTTLDLSTPLKYGSFIVNDIIQEIYDVSLTEIEGTPTGVRAVVNLGYYRNGEITYDAQNKEMVVSLINSVKYVDVEEVNGQNAVIIETNENPAFNVTNLGDSVLVDVIHAKLQEADNAVIVQKHGIDSVMYQQYDDSSLYDAGTRFTRVTVNLENDITSDNVYVDTSGSKIIVYVADQTYGSYSYARNLSTATSEFGLDVLGSGSYPVNYNSSSHSVSFSIPKDQVKKTLEMGDNKVDDGIVNKITVNEAAGQYQFTIYLVENTQYQVHGVNQQFGIAFANTKLKNSEFKDMLIVVDAGHGDHDPGALSPNGVKEKDVVLKASLILKKKLENAGFKVYMTRERDQYVKINDRASIANQLNADLFVSIHANAAGSSSAIGIETLYMPDSKRNNKTLATLIQDQLIAYTNNVDRGIKSRSDLGVLRGTKMDAVLVELGFLSNSQDEVRLLSESYLEKCAEAIVEGIIDFVD